MRTIDRLFPQSVRISCIILLLLSLAVPSVGGDEDAGEKQQIISQNSRPLHDSIKTQNVPTGLLYDTVIPLSEIHLFDGRPESKPLDLKRWKQILFELRQSSINQPFLPTVKSVDTRAKQKYHSRGVFPIALLDLKYNTIKKEIPESSTYGITDDTDEKMRQSSVVDFNEEQVFAASILDSTTRRGGNVTFVLDSACYFSNRDQQLRSIEIDFDDGQGPQKVTFDQEISVHYATTGEKVISLMAVDEDENPLESSFILDVPSLTTPDPHEVWDIQGVIPYEGRTASGRAYIYRAEGHTVLMNPVIVTDGFDMFNTRGWDEFYGLMNQEGMLENLRSQGFDLVFLDFDDSLDYMQRNAFVLTRLIERIHEEQSGDTPLVIVGPSMGGLVVRYALAYMEKNGIEHNTRTFISFDAPHQGANVPLGLQHWVTFFAAHSAEADEMLDMLKAPASRQMLVYHCLQTSEGRAACDPLHTVFANEMADLGGYPHNVRKVAISNGSGYGLGLPFNPGDQLIEYEYRGWVKFLGIKVFVEITGNVWSVPDDSPETMIFEGKVLEDTGITIVSGTQPIDNAPGGTRSTNRELAEVDPGYGDISTQRPDHCFVPIISALDIDTSDLFYDIAGDSRIVDKTPFDEIYFSSENQEHVYITPENAEWFNKEVNYGRGFIINHHCTDISNIPDAWVQKAKSDLRIGYSHTSHGSQLVTGISAFKGIEGSTYDYTSSDWGANTGLFLNDYWANEYADDLGHSGDLEWYGATVTMLDNPDNDRNVVMWSWCDGVSDNTEEGIDDYLDAMNQLERDYPDITFIYMTGHVDGTGASGNLHRMNERIRTYCRDNNKILFDFADIESYDPDGVTNYMQRMADDNCDYDSDRDGSRDTNWADGWIAANPGSDLAQVAGRCDECAHSQRLNCVLKGRAFWWMMARIAGWDPSDSSTKLYFPHVASTTVWETELCVINTSDSQSLTGTFKAYNNAGVHVSEDVAVTLTPHGRREITVGDEFTGPAGIGYIIFESDRGTVSGYTKFYREGQYRVAIPATSEVNTGDIYVSHIASSNAWWTGVSLLNTTSSPKTLTIEFDNGTIMTKELAAYEHSAFTIRSIFDGLSQTDIASAVITGGSGVVGLELFGSMGKARQLSGILLKDKTCSTIYYPHVASNATWWTGIVAYNPSVANTTITITPYNEEGISLIPRSLEIDGQAKYIGTVAGLDLPVDTAWLQIDATSPVTGFELFATQDGNRMAGYTGVDISGKEGVFAKLEKDGWTGIAFVNTEDDPATVALTAYDDSGTVIAAKGIDLDGHEKIVGNPDGIFTGDDITAATYITYSSDREVVGFQLNASSNGMMLDALPGM
ncbi:MAG TPA: hypothetical protein PLA74_01795 [Syntrophales bacterium]|nr:hypothetical protein [Syntrophales bacterium]HPQ43684.1 hypothetical protein [Syntrophales bacterium]